MDNFCALTIVVNYIIYLHIIFGSNLMTIYLVATYIKVI